MTTDSADATATPWAVPVTTGRTGFADRPWLWLALALLLYTPFIDTEIGQGNVASDLAAIESVGERGTFFINESTYFNTIDKFRHDGFYFSQKSPIFHAIAAAPYSLLVRAGYRFATHPDLCLRVLVLFMSILPMGSLLWLIYINPWVRTHSTKWRVGFTAIFALGSLLTPFALTLNHYVPASAALMGAVHLLIRLSMEARRPTNWEALGIGFLVSLSIASDIPPGFLLGLAVAAAWLFRCPWRLPALVAGALPIALLYMGLNMVILDSPLPPNMHEEEMMLYEGSFWKDVYDKMERGEGGYYQQSYGRRIFHSAVGYRGMYWMMPLLVLATLAAIRLSLRRERGAFLAMAFAVFPVAIVATAMRWALDPGGGTYALRYAFASVPPLFVCMAHPAVPRAGAFGRVFFASSTAWGVLIAMIGVLNPWPPNTLSAFPPMENIARFCLQHPDRLPISWIDDLIERTSLEPETAWLDLGLAHLGAGRLDAAEDSLKRAVAEDPEAPLPYYHLGIAQDMAGRPGSAVRTYETLLELQPDNVGAWNNFGLFHLKSGNLPMAKAAYRRSLELQPGNQSALWGMNTIHAWEERMGVGFPPVPTSTAS